MSEDQIELLSERELELVRLLSRGFNKEIARELHISPNTVKVHLRNIYGKLKVGSRTEATVVAVRMGWVEIAGPEGGQAAADQGRSAEEIVPQEEPEPVPDVMLAPEERVAPAVISEPPLAPWQRIYLIGSALLVVLGLWLVWPSEAERSVPFPDRRPQSLSWSADQLSRWQSMAQMPTPRSRLAVVAHGGQIYAIAGATRSGVSDAVEIYWPDADEWTRGADKPTPVESVGAVGLDGEIYVPGGRMSDGKMSNRLEIYEPGIGASGAWTTGTSLPRGVCAYALAEYGDDLYLFGGWDGRTYVAESYRYSPREDEWYSLAPMPTPRAFAGAGVIGGRVYVVGGYDGQSELGTCEVYDPVGDAWEACPSMNAPRSGLSVAVIADTLYAIGGGWKSYLVENEYLSPPQGTWMTFPSPVLQEWRDLGIAVNDTSIYAIGGWDGEFLGTNRAYRAIYLLYLPSTIGQRDGSPE
jgi:DNA-binding CsgD family transcriptional regulator/N-acetylneuraminic acid mutarotase